MCGKRFTVVLALIFFSLWGALYLESELKNYFMLELFAILLFIIYGLIVMYRIAAKKRNAWGAASVYFALLLVNSVLLYLGTGYFKAFFVIVILNFIGFLVSATGSSDDADYLDDNLDVEAYYDEVSSSEKAEDVAEKVTPVRDVETYDVSEYYYEGADKLKERQAKEKKSSKKKAAKKKTTKKKFSKKKSTKKKSGKKKSTKKKSGKKKSTKKKSGKKKSNKKKSGKKSSKKK